MTNIGTGYKQGNEWLCNDMPRREWTYSCIKQYHEIRAHLLCSKITTNYKWPNGTGHKTKVLIYNEMPTILLTNVSTTHTHSTWLLGVYHTFELWLNIVFLHHRWCTRNHAQHNRTPYLPLTSNPQHPTQQTRDQLRLKATYLAIIQWVVSLSLCSTYIVYILMAFKFGSLAQAPKPSITK